MIQFYSLNLFHNVFFEINIAFLNMSIYILIGRLNVDIQITHLLFDICCPFLVLIENFYATSLWVILILILLYLFILELKWVIIIDILVSTIFFQFMDNIMHFIFKGLLSVTHVNFSFVMKVCTERFIYLIVKMNSITLYSIISKRMMDSSTSKFLFSIIIILRSA